MSNSTKMRTSGVAAVKNAHIATVAAPINVSTMMTLRKTEAPDDRPRRQFHRHRAYRGGEGDAARDRGRQAEYDLQQKRQQENQRAGAGAKRRSGADAGAERSDPEHRQVEHGMRRASKVPHATMPRMPPSAKRTIISVGLLKPRPTASIPYMMQNSAAPVSTKPTQSSGRRVSSFGLSKNIVTSTMPRMPSGTLTRKIQRQEKIRGDEAADRRPEHRAELTRHLEIRHGADQRRLFHAAEQHQPSHRHHHGAAEALQHARRRQLDHIAAEAAQDRA